jgi:hypothetical protein
VTSNRLVSTSADWIQEQRLAEKRLILNELRVPHGRQVRHVDCYVPQ